MISRWIAILLTTFLAHHVLAIQNYDGNRPVRNDWDNISLRLEGQHLSRTCPALIEQKAKHTAPLVCRFIATAEKFYPNKVVGCASPLKYCCKKDQGTTKRCMVGQDKKFDFFSRLILRSKDGKLKCMWEGCPGADYFNLASYSGTIPANGATPAQNYTLEYRRWSETAPAPVAEECKPNVGHEECDPDNQTLPSCPVGCGGTPSPGPGPGG